MGAACHISAFGTNSTSPGHSVRIVTSTRTAATNGSDSVTYSSIGQSSRLQTVYIATPTGGVIDPSVTMVIIRMPKCTGSTPSGCTIGRKIGVSSSTSTVLSTNSPATNRNTRTSATTSSGSWVSAVIAAAMLCGACSKMIA